jgi:hypothetical protein
MNPSRFFSGTPRLIILLAVGALLPAPSSADERSSRQVFNLEWVGGYDTAGTAQDVIVSGGLAYIADGNEGLQIIDVSSTGAPQWVGEYITPGTSYGVVLSGNYAYLADGTTGLQVINISNPASPQFTGESDTNHVATDVAVSGNYAYLVEDFSDLEPIDVSNPANPVRLGGFNTNGSFTRLAVDGNHAYLAGSNFRIIDISDPSNPVPTGFGPWGTSDVVVAGDYAYVTRGNFGFFVSDVSDPADPHSIGGSATAGYATGVALSGDYAYVAEGLAGVEMFDVSDPTDPQWVGSYNTAGSAESVAVGGGHIFVADGSGGLAILRAVPPYSGTALFALGGPDGQEVLEGDTITMTVTATIDQVMAGCAYTLTAGGDAGAVITSRAVNTSGLYYLATDEVDFPNQDADLPWDLNTSGPVTEVLTGLRYAHWPGDPSDGLVPGTDVVVATYDIQVTGTGWLTLTLADPAAVETQNDPDGVPFDFVSVDPAAASVQVCVLPNYDGADFTGDHDVDLEDHAFLQRCFTGSGGQAGGECLAADLDDDTDVDLDDYTVMHGNLTGPNPALPCTAGRGALPLADSTSVKTAPPVVQTHQRFQTRDVDTARVAALRAGATRIDAASPLVAPDDAEGFPDGYATQCAGTRSTQIVDPGTYDQHESYILPPGHNWLFPQMVALDESQAGALPWNTGLNLLLNSTYFGTYILGYGPLHQDPFGMGEQTTPPPAGSYLIEYLGASCTTSPVNPATPLPPAFAEVKASADAYCGSLCGDGFEMTDFDMNQWRYACYKTMTTNGPRAYNHVTWGGSQCEKVVDNGLIQACNPLTELTATRSNLGAPVASCPDCDLDGDGEITLLDLILARNAVFGPRQQGLGLTFPIIRRAGTTIDESLTLDPDALQQAAVTYMEVAKWNSTSPVDCNDPSGHIGALVALTTSSPGSTTLFGQTLANEYCADTYGGAGICQGGALGYSIGHCRVNPDGTHVVRIVAGYCMRCE